MKIEHTSVHRIFRQTTHFKHCIMMRLLPLFGWGEEPGFNFRFGSKEIYPVLSMSRDVLQLPGTEQMVTEMFSLSEDVPKSKRKSKALINKVER